MNCIRIAVCNSLECYIKMSMPLNDVICYYEDAKKKNTCDTFNFLSNDYWNRKIEKLYVLYSGTFQI